MTVNFAGNVYSDSGGAVSGASVKLLETGTTTQEGSTVTTDSNGAWAFTEGDQDRYDIEITYGTSVRRIKWSDQISLKELDVRNNTDATTPALTLKNITNSTANIIGKFGGANTTRADNDEIYFTFELANSAGELTEYGRMTIVATDVTDGEEDGQFEFDVMKQGSLVKAFTIASSTSGAQSIDFNQDAITFGTGADTDISLTFDANSADGVLTWMEDEDYFKFSDDILMNSTEKINFGDTGTFIHQSADGVLTIESDTTVDINGAVALNGAITGATDITLSGELDAATLDISGNADIDGTTNLDAVDIDGAVQIDATFTSGVDGQGYDTKLFGDTSGAYILWDTSADKLLTAGGAVIDIVKDKLLIGGTAVTTTAAELNVLDAVSAGTVTASLGVVVDSNKDIGTFRNITLSGELDAGSLDISGNADIDGTTNLDAVDIDGAVQIDATFTSGVDGQGYETKFCGDTSGAYILWDTSADKLLTAGGAVVDIVKDKLLIGGTAVTTTAAELNVLDAVTAGTVTASLGVVVDSNKDIGTFRNITLSGELDAGSLDVSGNADIDGTLETDALTINGTAIVAQATASAVGGVELATAAEVTTSTDTARAVTPATLSDSIYGLKQIQVAVVAPGTDIAEGDGKAYVAIPPSLNGMDLVDVQTEVVTAGDGSTIDVDLQRVRKSGSGWASAVDMLSTNCTIEDGEVSSSTHSGTEFAINTSNDDVATSDLIRIDVDGNGGDTTVAKGLIVTMGFRIP